MNQDKRFKWVIFLVFATGFIFGQDYHTGYWLAVRVLFQLVMVFFVFNTLVAPIINDYIRNQEEQWKAVQSPPKKRPSSSGMARTSAAVARAIGTHVTVRHPEKPSASSDECKHAARTGTSKKCGDTTCLFCYPRGLSRQDEAILRSHPSVPDFDPVVSGLPTLNERDAKALGKQPDAGLDG